MSRGGEVVAVARSAEHRFSKSVVPAIQLLAGFGVFGDAHAGGTVKHRSRAKIRPLQPNLRQVHLIQSELFDEFEAGGFRVAPGEMGENVTTRGINLLGLPRGACLQLGAEAVVEITGLRNPCVQIDRFQRGLMHAVIDRDAAGQPRFRAGIMAIVVTGGEVRPGDAITVALPPKPHQPLALV
jgi:MOSC domain-containing protein YiiM